MKLRVPVASSRLPLADSHGCRSRRVRFNLAIAPCRGPPTAIAKRRSADFTVTSIDPRQGYIYTRGEATIRPTMGRLSWHIECAHDEGREMRVEENINLRYYENYVSYEKEDSRNICRSDIL